MYGKMIVLALMLFPMALASAAPTPTSASKPKPKPLQDGQPFPEQRDRILADLDEGKIYNEIKPEDRAKVVGALQRISLVLDAERTARVTEEDRIKAFNDQELVNAILTQARDDSRLICRREKVVGTNRPQNICISVAQRREMREIGGDSMRRMLGAQPASNIDTAGAGR